MGRCQDMARAMGSAGSSISCCTSSVQQRHTLLVPAKSNTKQCWAPWGPPSNQHTKRLAQPTVCPAHTLATSAFRWTKHICPNYVTSCHNYSFALTVVSSSGLACRVREPLSKDLQASLIPIAKA